MKKIKEKDIKQISNIIAGLDSKQKIRITSSFGGFYDGVKGNEIITFEVSYREV